MNEKIELRRAIREKLNAISAQEKATKSRAICLAISELPQWKSARSVALFAALEDEPNLDLLWDLRHDSAIPKTLIFPRIAGESLEWTAVKNRAEFESLTAARWKLREPQRAASNDFAVSELDLILVPGVAFSPRGERLGRGGGFYDRAFANHELRAFKIGICFAEQVVEKLPSEIHDREVNLVVSA